MLLATGSTALVLLVLLVLLVPLLGARAASRRRSGRVEMGDVERLLHASALPPATVARVLSRAERRGYGAPVLWRWAAVHGCERLALVVDAGVARSALVGHLEAGTSPGWRALEAFAGLARDPLPADAASDRLADEAGLPTDPWDRALAQALADWTTTSEEHGPGLPGPDRPDRRPPFAP